MNLSNGMRREFRPDDLGDLQRQSLRLRRDRRRRTFRQAPEANAVKAAANWKTLRIAQQRSSRLSYF